VKKDTSILIVGGGIGGLTVGAALRSKGFAPTIVERTDEWAPVGAGIVLGINAMNVLGRLGLTDALLERGRVLDAMKLTDLNGETLSAMSFSDFKDEYGPSITIHRARLHKALLSAHAGTEFFMGRTVDRFERTADGVEVEFSDGTSKKFDVVIGADGIRSSVREWLFPKTSITYSGYTCWRFVANGLPDVIETREMWGRGKRFGVVPLRDGQVYCFTTLNARADDAAMSGMELGSFKEMFKEFGGDVPLILDSLTVDDRIIHGNLEEVRTKKWSDGPTVLMGDAAHAMTPNMGQGAAMAIEDGWVLADCISEEENFEAAFGRYEKRRRPRVNPIQQQSWQIGKVAQWEGAILCAIRNSIMKVVPDKGAMRSLEKLLMQEL